MMTPTLAGYIRVSSVGGRDEEHLRSPEWQTNAITNAPAAAGYSIEMFPPELDVSGSKVARAILDGIVARIRAGALAGIMVAKLDRLSRLSPKDRVLLFEEIESAGGVILSATEQLDASTPEGRFAREVFLGVARLQWENFAKSFDDAKRGAIEAGIPVANRPAVGYRKREDRRLEPDPLTAPAVREAFEARARGAGPAEIGELLIARGVTPPEANRWSSRTVYAMLRNPIYKGVLVWGPYVNESGIDAPIVDLATWEAAQRPQARTLSRVSADSTWLLSGIIRCEACRHSMQGTPDGRGTRVYRCARIHGDGTCPSPARVIADDAEREIVEAFWQLTENVAAHATTPTADGTGAAQEALDAAQTRLSRYMAPEVQDALDPATWAAGLRERQEAVTDAASALGHTKSASSDSNLVDVQTLRDAWERATTVQRRELLALRIDAVAARGSRQGERHLTVWPAGSLSGEAWPARGRRKRGESIPALQPFPDAPKGARVLTA